MNLKRLYITLLCCLFVCDLFAQRKSSTIDSISSLSDYPAQAERIIRNLENHGYPFASVALKTADVENGDMTPIIVIDSNIFVTFDSIVLKGDVKLSKRFLRPYLGLRKGMPYNEQLMQAVDAKLAELPFATVLQPSGVSFVKDKAYLYVYLGQRRTNQFDGYVGLVPVDERNGKVAVSGDLSLALQNIFRIGESIGLHWYSSERKSQHLDVAVRFPYLFGTRFGAEGTFLLDKKDTSYLNLNFRVGIPYSFLNNSYIEPYFDYTSSSILNPALLQFDSDSGYIDFHKTAYGLKVHYRKLDYVFNPRRGVDLYGDLSAGRRRILANQHVNPEQYTDLQMVKTTYSVMGSVQGYLPIGRRFVITPRIQAGSLLAGPHYFNELFKIGGPDRIRGFNPNDLYASTYLLYSAEVRFLFGKNSFANIFFDGGVYEQQMEKMYLFDTPFGFGAGIHLAVRSGIFYLEYALGRQQNNPLSLKTGKIHFGIKVEF
ncbi:MAG: BamA/TamA family outer membrane protein [Bacteroidales bacterium]|nr:BamA/TamA family outer membrane protein [Bacteroidales bacterium]